MALATNGKMVSERHQIASLTKPTAGDVVKKLKKQGIKTTAKEVVEAFKLINGREPEWHHSGFYGTGKNRTMGRTFFFQDYQIQELAQRWHELPVIQKAKQDRIKEAHERQNRQIAFLYANGIKRTRITTKPMYFIETAREMNGKHGWFDSTGKTYNLPEYYSGWELTEEQYQRYLKL